MQCDGHRDNQAKSRLRRVSSSVISQQNLSIFKMKKVLTTLTLMVGISLFPLKVQSQEYPGCFGINLRGQFINLDSICSQLNQNISFRGVLEVPIKRRQGNIPVIEATFNKQETFEMLIDTGASITTLTNNIATKLGLERGKTVKIETASGFADPSTSKVGSIQVGEIVVDDVEVIISPSLSIGLLGQNFFADYDLTIKQNTIEFRRR